MTPATAPAHPLTGSPAIAAARQRSERLDSLVIDLGSNLPQRRVAIVALAAYGRRELTPRGEAELLFLYNGDLSVAQVTEVVSYPLWEQAIRVEPLVLTPAEAASQVRRSWSATMRFLDARFIAGDTAVFDDFFARAIQPWRRDRERLRHRLRSDAQHRHATHPSVTASLTPDLIAGRGGLLDISALRWLDVPPDARTMAALEFLLAALGTLEEVVGHTPHRMTARMRERLRGGDGFLTELYGHARWVAFNLDSAVAPMRDDRQLGSGLSLRHGKLVADRPPPLRRAPALGLRIANLIGLAPPSAELLDWARSQSAPIRWDAATQDQFWLLLRAADWRAWDFLDVTELILRYLPELAPIRCAPAASRAGDLALDHHSFLALRDLHEWSETDDLLARRVWRGLRHRDWVYLAVLLHELPPESARAAVDRIGLPAAARDTIQLAVANYQLVSDIATRRDFHDEDLVLDLATRIGNRQRLSTLFHVTVAHELACGAAGWTPWKADLMRQLFSHLELALRQPGEVGARRTRSLEQHRERIIRALQRRRLDSLTQLVGHLPRRYILTRTPAFAARHLALLGHAPPQEREVRMRAFRRRQPGLWDVLIVARDRPGLLAMLAGVLALRGVSVLAADAATSSDGLVLDVFTVKSSEALAWPQIQADLQAALAGRIPLHDLLGARPVDPDDAAAIHVATDNTASQFFTLVEVRAPDQVGLLYRIASAFHAVDLDIHHARIATYPDGALDVFYVRDLSGQKLSDSAAAGAANAIGARLRGTHDPA